MRNTMDRRLEKRLAEQLVGPHFTDRLDVVSSDSRYPARLRERLGAAAPPTLAMLGNPALLDLPSTALFCSVNCPAAMLLPTFDLAARWREAGRCVISGFHSPVEKECMRILLRGQQPLISELCTYRT